MQYEKNIVPKNIILILKRFHITLVTEYAVVHVLDMYLPKLVNQKHTLSTEMNRARDVLATNLLLADVTLV